MGYRRGERALARGSCPRGSTTRPSSIRAPFWKHVFEPFIRQSAGLGKAPDPKHSDPDRYEHFYAHVDIVVAGGGIAGLQAALEAGRAGAKVLLCEQTAHWGGRAPVDGVTVDGARQRTGSRRRGGT
jgi:NADPH-dependent 2,4-dienoyl-CoA reductase/sulfur reductase-like enzyme